MYHIAIVEDEIDFSAQLQNYLKEYQEENGVEFKISVFRDGADYFEKKPYMIIVGMILLFVASHQLLAVTIGKIR